MRRVHGSLDAATTALGQRMPCQSECTVNLHLTGNEYQMYFAPSKLIARQSWFGSLIESKADGTGQMYMRNRYYNPATGTFTQEDPIGIAGGLNVYGFEAGDPVSDSDPYGLKVIWGSDNASSAEKRAAVDLWSELSRRVQAALRSPNRAVRSAAEYLRDMMNDMISDPTTTYQIVADDYSEQWEQRTGGGQEETGDSPDRYVIQVDNWRDSTTGFAAKTAPWLTLAHELGGAHGRRHGGTHHDKAVEAEDAARTMVGCGTRGTHDNNDPPTCK